MAITYVESHYHELIREEEVAGLCAMSIRSFCRIFKKEQGETFRTYLMGYRINKARELLRIPGVSVAGAAFATGFSDMSYFSRVFRQIEGQTPSAFQQKQIPEDVQ
ncbi:helix-turn-helix transcriptional regulator [Thiothrix subterranea]|uniref:Helix-turn-helix transcriptional regulator n=1 Tax=Thiothrix subterranea TaxID=2735563 RepID=A0AA51R4F2_9GAMM|nr:helix-turn-helix transcriptional regulator [Thiothrix subterranea]MDQ5767940.1 helix-turn-helix transcriptional regulator [Thiothrix subterranea]WML86601.1 helix-turn-helix transcriptional regulator [Thiothrix subterranea]